MTYVRRAHLVFVALAAVACGSDGKAPLKPEPGEELQRRAERRLRYGGSALPIHVVKDVARATRRTGTADGRDADCTEAIDKHAWLSSFVIETDTAFDKFLVALQDSGAHAGGRPR